MSNNTAPKMKQKRGTKPKNIDGELRAEMIKLIKLRVPMKWIGVITGSTAHFVKRVMAEENLVEFYNTIPDAKPVSNVGRKKKLPPKKVVQPDSSSTSIDTEPDTETGSEFTSE